MRLRACQANIMCSSELVSFIIYLYFAESQIKFIAYHLKISKQNIQKAKMDQKLRTTGKFGGGKIQSLRQPETNPFEIAANNEDKASADNEQHVDQKFSFQNALVKIHQKSSDDADSQMKMFNSVHGILSADKISPQALEEFNSEQQSFQDGKKSISRSSSNLTMQDKFFDQDNNPKPRRSSIDKRRKPITKRRKYIDLHEEYLQVRYVLFYADDVVQDALTAKKLVQNQYMTGDQTQSKLSETFKKALRENQGIYFDINISPRKRANSSMMLPFANLQADGQSSEDFPNPKVWAPSSNQRMEQLSPTFQMIAAQSPKHYELTEKKIDKMGSFKLNPLQKNESFNPNYTGMAHNDDEESESATSSKLAREKEYKMDRMLLSQTETETPQISNRLNQISGMNSKFSNDSLIDHNEIDKEKIIAYEMHQDSVQNIDQFLEEQSKQSRKEELSPRQQEEAKKEIPNQENKNTVKSGENDAGHKSNGSDQYKEMRNMSSFINRNYDSPNIKDIKKVIRRREIDELFNKEKSDAKQGKRKPTSGSTQKMDDSPSPLEQQPTQPMKQINIGESSMYQKRKQMFISKGSTKHIGNPLTLLQIEPDSSRQKVQTNRIDETDQNLEDDESAKATQEHVEQKEFFDDIHQYIGVEPKSGLVKQDHHVKRKSTYVGPVLGRSGLKKKKSNSSVSEDEEDMNSLQSQSGTNSDDEDPLALQLMRMKSQILNSKQLIGGKKLKRQTFMLNQGSGQETNEQIALRHYEMYHKLPRGTATINQLKESSAGIEGWANWTDNLVDDSEILMQSSLVQEAEQVERQKSWLIGNLSNNNTKLRLQKKDPQKEKSGVTQMLSIKKMETAQPSNLNALDTTNQHSRNQKTSHRVDKDSIMKSKMLTDKSQQPQLSSNLPELSEIAKQRKRKRKKEIKQLKKERPMTEEEKEMDEEKQYIKLQFKHFKYFKRIAQQIKAQPIKCKWEDSQNSIAEMYQENTGTNNDDTTQGDLTNTHNPYFYDGNLRMHKSIQSRDNSSSTPNPNSMNQNFGAQMQSWSQMNPRSSNISDAQIGGGKKDLSKKASNIDSDLLEQANKNNEESKSEQKSKRKISKSRTDDLSISGYNNQVKYQLNVPNNLDFCQKSKSQSSFCNKSSNNNKSGSLSRRNSILSSQASDKRSQRSRQADELRRLKSQVSLTKKLHKKHSKINLIHDPNSKTQMTKFADQQQLDQLKSQSKANQEKAQAHNFFLNVINLENPNANNQNQYSNAFKEKNPVGQKQGEENKSFGMAKTSSNNQTQSSFKEVNSAEKSKYQNLKIKTKQDEEEKSSPTHTISSSNEYPNNRYRAAENMNRPQQVRNNLRQHEIEQVAQINARGNQQAQQQRGITQHQQYEEQKLQSMHANRNEKRSGQIQLKVCDQRMDVDDEKDSNRKQEAVQQYQQHKAQNDNESHPSEEGKNRDVVGELGRDQRNLHEYIYDADPNRRHSLRNAEPGTAEVRSNFSKLKREEVNAMFTSHQSPEFYHKLRKIESKGTSKETDNITFDVRSRNLNDNQLGNQSEFSFVVGQSPANLNKLNQESAMNISFKKTDSLKKSESPTHLRRIHERESQNSLSKISKSSLNKLNSSIAEYNGSGERSDELVRPRINVINNNKGTVSQGSSNKSSQIQNKKGLSFNLKSCLRELDSDIEKRYPLKNVNQLKPIIEQSVFSAISQKSTSSLGKISNKKGQNKNAADPTKELQMKKQISRYEREFHQTLSHKKKYVPRKSYEYPENYSQSLNDQQERLKMPQPQRGGNGERALLSKSSNQESRYLAMDQRQFSNEFDFNLAQREQNTPQRQKDKYMYENEEGVRTIPIVKVSKQQSRSNETLLIEKPIHQSDHKHRYSKSRKSSAEYQQDSTNRANMFEAQDQESIQHQSNMQDMHLQYQMLRQGAEQPVAPRNTVMKNRLSLQGMQGMDLKNQISENPQALKKREKSEQQTNNRINSSNQKSNQDRQQMTSAQKRNVKSRVVNQCLDELQSIFTRHHGKVNNKINQQSNQYQNLKATANTILSPHGKRDDKSERQNSGNSNDKKTLNKSTYGYQTTVLQRSKDKKNESSGGGSRSQYTQGYNNQQPYVISKTQKYPKGMLKQNYHDLNESMDDKQNTSISNISQSDQIRYRRERHGYQSPNNQHGQIIQPKQPPYYQNDNFDKNSIYNGSVSHLGEEFAAGSVIDQPQYSEFSRLGDNVNHVLHSQFKTPAKNSGAINSSNVLSPQNTVDRKDRPSGGTSAQQVKQLNKTQKYGDEYSKKFGYNNCITGQHDSLKKTTGHQNLKKTQDIYRKQHTQTGLEKRQMQPMEYANPQRPTLQYSKPPGLFSQQISQTSPNYKRSIDVGPQEAGKLDEFQEDGYDPFEEDGYDPFDSKEPSQMQNDSFLAAQQQQKFTPFTGYQEVKEVQMHQNPQLSSSFQNIQNYGRNTMTYLMQQENDKINEIELKKQYTQLSHTFSNMGPKPSMQYQTMKNRLQAPRGMREYYGGADNAVNQLNEIREKSTINPQNEINNDQLINQVFEQDLSNTANRRSKGFTQTQIYENPNGKGYQQQSVSRNNLSNNANQVTLPPYRPSTDSRNSKGARQHFVENLMQEIHKPKDRQSKVIYENNKGPRYSIISETVQAQPYRPAPPNADYKQNHMEHDDNPFGAAGPGRDESEYSQHFGTRPSGAGSKEPSSANYMLNKFNKSGKSGASGETGNYQFTHGGNSVLGQMVQNQGGNRYNDSSTENIQQQLNDRDSLHDKQYDNTPFGLQMVPQQISEQVNQRFVSNHRQDLMKDN